MMASGARFSVIVGLPSFLKLFTQAAFPSRNGNLCQFLRFTAKMLPQGLKQNIMSSHHIILEKRGLKRMDLPWIPTRFLDGNSYQP